MKIYSQKPFKTKGGIPGYFLELAKEGDDDQIPYKTIFIKLFLKKDVIYMLTINLIDPERIDKTYTAFLNSFLIQ